MIGGEQQRSDLLLGFLFFSFSFWVAARSLIVMNRSGLVAELGIRIGDMAFGNSELW